MLRMNTNSRYSSSEQCQLPIEKLKAMSVMNICFIGTPTYSICIAFFAWFSLNCLILVFRFSPHRKPALNICFIYWFFTFPEFIKTLPTQMGRLGRNILSHTITVLGEASASTSESPLQDRMWCFCSSEYDNSWYLSPLLASLHWKLGSREN